MSAVSYRKTKVACYLGYITQAISINLLPLLYVTFQREFSVTLSQLGLLATLLFVVQMTVDFVVARFGKKLPYRVGCVAAHVFATLGLILMSFLPQLMPNPYVGLLIAVLILSVGGGLTEVLISPVIDAIPGDGKAGEMSLLHSFYCWGVVSVSLLSTLFFVVCGTVAWRWLVLLWALVPAVTAWLFAVVPLPQKPEERIGEHSAKKAFGSLFWLMLALMLCGGAAEMCTAQWVSLFAERGLHISKTVGDLLGPCAFAVLQGTSRVVYGRLTLHRDARRLLAMSAAGCVVGFVLIAVSPNPVISLLGFGLSGWFVGPMWPGILSLASARYPHGGTAMFATLALFGDIGCSLAPAMVGVVSDGLRHSHTVADALRGGLGICTVFPVLLLIGLMLLRGRKSVD